MPPETVTGPLRPVEVATAAVMGALAVVLAVVGWILPHASLVQSLAAVPLGVVAHRHRPRALVAAVVAAGAVAFLCAGTGPVFSIITAAVVGGLVGDVKRRGRGVGTLALGAVVAAPAVAAMTDGLLAIFSSSRKLTLRQIANLTRGLTGTTARVPGLRGPSHAVDHWVHVALGRWWLTIGVVVGASFLVGLAAAWVVLGGVLDRMAWMVAEDRLAGTESAPTGTGPADAGPVGPVPVRLRSVRHRYHGAPADALVDIDLDVGPGRSVALVGVNGSGKSTLARVLAGAAPTDGTVERPGDAGLGRTGGTALVAQRPESQVLGVRVADDVVWGLPPGAVVDVEDILTEVGLAGMGERETSTLSGGELQRLAVAAALGRRPSLLVSDESTSMVDHDGRERLTGLLAALPRTHGTSVVHVTHRAEEAAALDEIVQLDAGRIVDGDLDALLGPAALPTPPAPARHARHGARPVLEVRGVAHTYAAGTPWAQRALDGIDLEVGAGDGLLVVGGNGSGKSTLAWVLAGLLRPGAGTCLLDGQPVAEQVGSVALAFQHARLQLLRPTVGAEIRSAGGVADAAVAGALGLVGLGADLAERPIDQLSGGQQRRVALAGLLARRPRVVVLDEPMAGLDPPGQRSLLAVLADLRAAGVTLVVISHDLEGMGAVCPRTVRLAAGRLVGDPVAGGLGRAVAR